MPKPLTEEALVDRCERNLDLFEPNERKAISDCKAKVERGDYLSDDEIDLLSDLADRY